MSTKFTPGPWTHREAIAHPPKQHVLRASGGHLCSLEGKDREANARLIAAAPDLYAALEELLTWSALITKGELHELTPARVAARAALRKARGE